MIKSLLEAYRESWLMLAGIRKDFFLLLLPISLIKIIAPLIIPFMLRMIFDAMESGNGNQVLSSVAQSSVVFCILLLTVFIVNIWGDAWATRLSFYGLQKSYLSFFNLPVCQLISNYSKGEIFNRIKAGCWTSLQLWIKTIDLISNFIAILGLLFMASLISPYILGVVLLLAITNFVISLYLGTRNRIFTQDIQTCEAYRIEMLHSVIYDSQFLKMNKSQSLISELYSKAREVRFDEEYRQIKMNALFTSVIDTLAASFHSLLGIILFFQNRENDISLGRISSASSIFTNLRSKSGDLAQDASNLPNTVVPIQRMEELLRKNDKPFQQSLPLEQCGNVIEIENVSLQINDRMVLDRISLNIRYGEKVAIIGRNGSGKSTLMRLLAGHYQFQSGNIEILGQEASSFYTDSDRSKWISYIPGEPQLYTKLTVLENIEMGTVSNDEDMIDIVLANLSSGEEFFKATLTDKISGGESQRVNISRAMLETKLLALADEPTASLDIELADQIMDYLLRSNETLLFITHNPIHAMKADRIIFMENGRIVTEFTPHLAKESEIFAKWAGYQIKGA